MTQSAKMTTTKTQPNLTNYMPAILRAVQEPETEYVPYVGTVGHAADAADLWAHYLDADRRAGADTPSETRDGAADASDKKGGARPAAGRQTRKDDKKDDKKDGKKDEPDRRPWRLDAGELLTTAFVQFHSDLRQYMDDRHGALGESEAAHLVDYISGCVYPAPDMDESGSDTEA